MPLQGFLNALVYMRPRFMNWLRTNHPELLSCCHCPKKKKDSTGTTSYSNGNNSTNNNKKTSRTEKHEESTTIPAPGDEESPKNTVESTPISPGIQMIGEDNQQQRPIDLPVDIENDENQSDQYNQQVAGEAVLSGYFLVQN